MPAGRTLGAGFRALRSILPRFASIARELSLEIVGFVFVVFSLVFVFGPYGFIQAYRQLPDSLARLIVAALGALMFGWFGYDSFRRARRLARKR